MRRISTGITLFILTAVSATAGTKVKEYDLAFGNISGETVRGPRTIIAHRLNVLRYNYKFNSVATYSQAVDLWSKLTEVAVPLAQTQVPKAEPGRTKGPDVTKLQKNGVTDVPVIQHIAKASEITARIYGRCDGIQNLAADVSQKYIDFSKLVTTANSRTGKVRAAGRELTSFLGNTTGDPAQTIDGIEKQLDANSIFSFGIAADWPNVSDIEEATSTNQAKIDNEEGTYPAFMNGQSAAVAIAQRDLESDDSPKYKAAISAALAALQDATATLTAAAAFLSLAKSQNARITAGLPEIRQDGQKYLDFVAARNQLLYWKDRMETLSRRRGAFESSSGPSPSPDPFSFQMEGTCEFSFSRTKTTSITLTRVDQMPGTTAANPETVLSVTVECTSPFSISAGVAFSTIPEREFAIQPVATTPGSSTTVNTFVSTANSSFHPLVLGMVHVRLFEPSERISFHGSFGVAANIRSQNAGGSDAEFLIGPSISFFRTMFLTPGLHIGREVSLGAGYHEGDPVPSSITTPPLEKSYKPAFGFAVTFTKP
jgi:hypothetical protein